MTGAEALVFFTLEVARATTQLKDPKPVAVHAVYVDSRDRRAPATAVAYVVPENREVHVLWHFLWGKSKKTLRCVARHEAIHIVKGHIGKDDHAEHDEVDQILAQKWNEPVGCGLR